MRWPAIITALACCLLAVAPAAATGPFIVFFENGSARPDRSGEMILDNAAEWFRGSGVLRLRLVGSTDRVGSAASNLLLSRRRARNVRDGLIRRGVPASALEVAGHGERRLSVATADGVAERQNRYVLLEVVALAAATAAPPAPGPSGSAEAPISEEDMIYVAEQEWTSCVFAASQAMASAAGRAGSGVPSVAASFDECRRFEDALRSALDARRSPLPGEETAARLESIRSALAASATAAISDIYQRNNHE